MKYNIRENLDSDDVIAHLILSLMEPLFEGKSPVPFDPDKGELEVQVFLNKLEVDPEDFFEHLQREFYRLIEERAKELVEEKLLGKGSALDQVREGMGRVRQFVEDEVSKWLPKARANWD